jgi:hypothetical protein
MNALANARRKISPQQITGLPGQLQPDDDVGLFIACLSGDGAGFVGAGLPAKAISCPTMMLTDTPLSLASQLLCMDSPPHSTRF